MVMPPLVTWRLYHLSSFGWPSMISALMPSHANSCAAVPPELLSLIPPVSGLLPPAERRPDWAAGVPVRRPGANTSLLFGPRGWQVGGTSAATMDEVNPRPPCAAHSAGTSSNLTVLSVMFTR